MAQQTWMVFVDTDRLPSVRHSVSPTVLHRHHHPFLQALREGEGKRAELQSRLAAYASEEAPAKRAREALLRQNMEESTL